jgi:hypothetical protein
MNYWNLLFDRFHETNRIRHMELKPTDLILRRREAPSRRMAAGSVSLVAVLRDARKSALLRTRLTMRRYDSNLENPGLLAGLLPVRAFALSDAAGQSGVHRVEIGSGRVGSPPASFEFVHMGEGEA